MAGGRAPDPLEGDAAPRLHIDDLRTSPRPVEGYALHGTPTAPRMTPLDHLPRRSLLADADAVAAAGRHTLDPFAAQSPSMRHLHHFRPVASPLAAMQPTDRTGWRRDGDLAAAPSTSSRGHTANADADFADGAAANRVRRHDAWHTDMWLYMKNAHPVISVFAAPVRHPYKRRDRALVLLLALLVLFLLCGVFATQECCASSLDVPVAVVSRRLDGAAARPTPAMGNRRCIPFFSECDESALVCTEGSVSSNGEVAGDADGSQSDGITAIEAIFGILIIANGNDTATTNTSTTSDGTGVNGSSTSQPPTTARPSTNVSALQSLSMVLMEPVDGGVYSVQSTLPIRWEIRAIDGGVQPLGSFSLAFSADDKPFMLLATDIRASTSETNASVFRFDWNLRGNSSLLCSKCVLRACSSTDSGSQVCIRSDGGNTSISGSSLASTTRGSTAAASAKRGITFRIVREVISCSCGLAHAPFVELSYLIALCVPLTALLLQYLVLQVRSYSTKGATRAGRVVVVVVLAAACVGCGYFLAQMTEAKFFDQTSQVALLWLGTFGLCLLVAFVYCSALWLAIFSLRWKREATSKHYPQQQQQQHQRWQQRQQQQQQYEPSDSERVVEMSDFVLTRHQEQQQQREASGAGGGIV